jgi:dTDP-4-dehydrorhamnose 3,5-epimerase
MCTYQTSLPGVIIIEPILYGDTRGLFKETFQQNRYSEHGISLPFVQDNFSRSKRGVLRGLHFQKNKPQGKLVTCLRGAVLDIIVNIDRSSLSFGSVVKVELNDVNHKQVWIPPGYAHGFCVISDEADFFYKCTEYYDPSDEAGIIWSDRDLGIDWPVKDPLVSKRDQEWPSLSEFSQKIGDEK